MGGTIGWAVLAQQQQDGDGGCHPATPEPPPPTSLRVYAFRGLRTVHGKKLFELPAADLAPLEEAMHRFPTLYSGHVGFSTDNGRSSWGLRTFEPENGQSWAETLNMTQEELMAIAKTNRAGPGIVRNDRSLFEFVASKATHEGWNTVVFSKDITAAVFAQPPPPPNAAWISKRLVEVQRRIEELSEAQGEWTRGVFSGGHGFKYVWPWREPKNGRYFEDELTGNCVTFPELCLGLPIIVGDASGCMKAVMRDMEGACESSALAGDSTAVHSSVIQSRM